MNVYDFDNTIYDGDSTKDFYFYNLKRNPFLLCFIFVQMHGFLLYVFDIYSKTQFKEKFYSYLRGINDIDKVVDEFWKINRRKIKGWYLNKKESTDLIISASPDFLLRPICNKLSVFLVASEVNKTNGKFLSENCYGEEKLVRYKRIYKNKMINEFYSDSLSDKPLANYAKYSFIVKESQIINWEEYSKNRSNKIYENFLSVEFIKFIAIGLVNVVNGVLFAFLYSTLFQDNVAFIMGYITNLSISYILNTIITFKEPLSISRYVKFCISYIPNFIIQNVVVFVSINILGWYRLFGYILAAIIAVPITFLFTKHFAFNK